MIAMVLEHVEGLVLDLPAGAATGGEFLDVVAVHFQIGDEGVAVGDGAVRACDRDCQPVDAQGVAAVADGQTGHPSAVVHAPPRASSRLGTVRGQVDAVDTLMPMSRMAYCRLLPRRRSGISAQSTPAAVPDGARGASWRLRLRLHRHDRGQHRETLRRGHGPVAPGPVLRLALDHLAVREVAPRVAHPMVTVRYWRDVPAETGRPAP